ncbi:hypothetical protein P8452_42539 [Trifolium repens]|nr:hypothetical protein P8452_42539 [Trifolium repens]
MAEKKKMRDYIMGNQERTKRNTLGEYFIESKLDDIKRQLEALASSFCDHCYLDNHESEECPTRNLWDDCEIVHSDEQHNPHPPNWDINYIPPCLRHLNEKLRHEGQVLIESEEALTEESTCEEQHKQDLVVVDMEKSKESPFILGQTILTIGDVIVEVQKGKESLEKIAIFQDPSIMWPGRGLRVPSYDGVDFPNVGLGLPRLHCLAFVVLHVP